MNGENYFELINNVVIPYINNNGGVNKFVFWPDLASCHYAKNVINLLKAKNVDFVEKFEIPPCTPEVRPIEMFWHLVKLAFHKPSKYPKTLVAFKSQWCTACQSISEDVIRGMFSTLIHKLRLVGQYGVSSLYSEKNKKRNV